VSTPNYTMRVVVRTKGGRTTSVWVPIAALTLEAVIDALNFGYYEGTGSEAISLTMAGSGTVT
jgi:hypothetical protein